MSVWFHVVVSSVVRLVLIVYGMYQDQKFAVKYTDIDYQVFTDAARYVVNGESPFERHTYRYTPFLAFLMIPNILISQLFGKMLFSFFDILTGYLIFLYVDRRKGASTKCAFLWWYNPLCMTVATRGNAESLMACATVATLLFLDRCKIVVAAVVYGFSVHFKLYTIIYSLPIYLSLNETNNTLFLKIVKPTKNCILFVIVSALAFLIPTLLGYYWYGTHYVDEAILYHLSRRDIRHNFSPYFYLLYLTDEWQETQILGLLMFLPQFLVLIIFGICFGTSRDLPLCLFAQTYVLVAFNKVCTSQYFLWFLCLLPLVMPDLNISRRHWIALGTEWFLGQGLWLLPAYLLEFQGLPTFLYVWLSSLVFLFVNVHILREVLLAYSCPKAKST